MNDINASRPVSAITGMTGFARENGTWNMTQWVWEARSVNGRGLDARIKLPQDFNTLEPDLRKICKNAFKRGNLQLSLTIEGQTSDKQFQINETLFDEILNFAKSKNQEISAGQIMSVPGIVTETSTTLCEDDDHKELKALILNSFSSLIDNLKRSRDIEGQALLPILEQAINSVEDAVKRAETISHILPQTLKDRLNAKLDVLLSDKIDPTRIAHEAAILAVKADVTEEIDRLKAHCGEARKILKSGSHIGRKLEFLSQEFNREINTLCSKSSEIDLTNIGLEMKSYVEQFREQSANVQ